MNPNGSDKNPESFIDTELKARYTLSVGDYAAQKENPKP
jgi:hypothetical protein